MTDRAETESTTPKTGEAGESHAPSARWWEFYLVRYLTGAFVGAGMLLVLIAVYFAGPGNVPDHRHLRMAAEVFGSTNFSKGYGIALLGVLGLAYCYLVSTPITVFHAGRMLEGWERRFSVLFWLLLGFFCLLLLVGGRFMKDGHPRGWLCWLSAVPAVWIIINEWATIVRLLKDQVGTGPEWYAWVGRVASGKRIDPQSRFVDFYIRLACARSKKSSIQLRESYSHLREHANSVFIVVLEVLFVFGFWAAYGLSQSMISVVAFCLLWLTPNIFLWGQANRIEMRLQEEGATADLKIPSLPS